MKKLFGQTVNAILASVGLATVAIALLGWGLYDATQKSRDAQAMLRESDQTLRSIAALRGTLALAESDQRGFLLTGQAQFRVTRDAALLKLQQGAAAIQTDMAADPESRARTQQLVKLISDRTASMHKTEQIRTTAGLVEASEAFAGRLPEQTSGDLDALVTRLAQYETARLDAKQRMVFHQGEEGVRHIAMWAGLAIIASMIPLLWSIRRQSRERRRAETHLQAIAHSVPGAVYVYRLTPKRIGKFDFVSINARNVLGIEREQILQDGGAVRKLVIDEDRDRVTAAIFSSAEKLSPLDVDFRIRMPGDVLRWVRSSAIPARHVSGDTLWNGYWFDITDIKQTEQALRDAMRRLEDAQSVAAIGDWTCDLATGAVSWSPQVYSMLQRDPKLTSPTLEEVVAIFENGAELTANAFFHAQETGQPQTLEMTTTLPDSSPATLHAIIVPTVNEVGTVVGMHGTIQDITARKALEQRLLQAKEAADIANRAKTDFLATMSHEIRTPLSGMLGLLELINLMPHSPELRNALNGVRESGKSLQRIIDDILDFSKVEAGKLDIRPEPTRVDEVIHSLLRIHSGMASRHGLELHHVIDPAISAAVMVDELRLQQILGNFLSNAIKFTRQGRVELRVQLLARAGERETLRFQVEDSGVGISPERQQKLFRPFEQAEENIASRFGGTGLGLAISRQLAELMGGEVSMSSELGKGTTMTLDLEVAVSERQPTRLVIDAAPAIAQQPAMEVQVEAVTFDNADRGLVLVVDDHPINRMLMRKQLNTLGFTAEEMGSGAEALQEWSTGRFALVLSDCNMPEMSGYQLSRHIRDAEAAGGLPRTPIIACSANVIGGVRQDCLDAGMDDYISKPTELAVLAEKMERWLPSTKDVGQAGAKTSTGETKDPAAQPTADAVQPIIAPRSERSLHAVAKLDAGPSRRVLDHFRRVNDVDVEKLIAAAAQRDMAAIAHLAHRIKGACGFVGETGLASVCSMIEQAGLTEDASAIDWLMGLFHVELEQLNARLDAA